MSTEKKCSICGAPFIDKSRCKLREVCFSSECIDERRRRNQNARNARQAEARRLAPDYVPPRRGRPKRDFHAFGAEHPVSRRALVIPTAVEAASERKSTNDLTTADADAAARANARNKSCGGCGRKFFDTTADADQALCGGKVCKRSDDERGLTRPWQSFDMSAGNPIVEVAR